jgi:hypothetical protein
MLRVWQTALLQLGTLGVIWIVSSLPGIARHVYGLFTISPSWPVRVYPIAQSYLDLHPYAVLCVCSVVFFGPISFVLPLLVLRDTYIHILLNIVHFWHGYISVWNLAKYYYATSNYEPDGFKLGGIFGRLENMATGYNSWTTRHKSLLVMRVLCAVLALYIALRSIVCSARF